MINRYNASHLGCLPVRVLQHNIIATFESTTPEFLEYSKRIINEKGLDPEFGFLINRSPTMGTEIIGPHVKNKEMKIYFDETFLAYLWCACYSLYVNSNLLIDPDSNFDITKANTLMDYAIKLKKEYIYWDMDMVNPEQYSEIDKDDVEKTNEIFQHAFGFILCHEFYHVESGHIDSEMAGKSDLSFELATKKLENENEADKKAVELMLSGCNSSNEKGVKYGIVSALCALLLIQGRLARTTHPDSDNRIIDALDGLELDDNDTCWLVANASLSMWENLYKQDIVWEEKSTFKELFIFTSRQCD